MNRTLGRQSGFGLVELMIGLLVGLIVVAAATSMLTTTLFSSNDSIKMARLEQEMRQVMTMLTRDLRRAAAWDAAVDVARVSLADPLTLSAVSGTVSVTSSGGNLDGIGAMAVGGTLIYYDGTTVHQGSITAYTPSTQTYTVSIATAWPAGAATLDGVPPSSWSILGPQPAITVSGNCFLFAYDTDASGLISTTAPNEFFGYRHVSNTTEKVVKIKTASGGDCTSSTTGWENLTDPDTVEITTFTVTTYPPAVISVSGLNIEVREYTVRISGRLKSDTSVVRTLQETIRVRNDRLVPST
jgi:type II secretory pathway component PulJ